MSAPELCGWRPLRDCSRCFRHDYRRNIAVFAGHVVACFGFAVVAECAAVAAEYGAVAEHAAAVAEYAAVAECAAVVAEYAAVAECAAVVAEYAAVAECAAVVAEHAAAVAECAAVQVWLALRAGSAFRFAARSQKQLLREARKREMLRWHFPIVS